MIQAALMFLPEETCLTLIVMSGLLIIVGFRKLGLTLLGSVLLMLVLAPFIDALMEDLPLWAVYGLCLLCGLSFLRMVLGGRVADYLISRLLYNIIMAPFWFIRWIVSGFRPGPRY